MAFFEKFQIIGGHLYAIQSDNELVDLGALITLADVGGSGGALINDTISATSSVYSSAKTDAQISTATAALVASAPSLLNTLNELASAINDDPNFAVTLSNQIAAKYTKPGSGIPASDLASAIQAQLTAAASAYQKPGSGIPSTDLASSVQSALTAAGTAVQPAALSAETTRAQSAEATNATNIATNAANVATNTANIATNATNIGNEVTRATAAENLRRIKPPLLATATAATAATIYAIKPFDCTNGSITVTALPSLASGNIGDTYFIERVDSVFANTLTIPFTAGDTTMTGSTQLTLLMPSTVEVMIVANPNTGNARFWKVLGHTRSDQAIVAYQTYIQPPNVYYNSTTSAYGLRPASPNPVTFFGPVQPATGGTTAGGTAAMATGDYWFKTVS